MKIYNTMARGKEEFVPREPGKVAMYVCGPTTYNYIHLGNARPIVFFDVVRRYLLYKGYHVFYVQNFTDIDDKIIKRSQEENLDPKTLAEKYIEEYYKDADSLNVMRADLHPKVSGHIPEIIEMVKTLIDKGYAYALDGDVYFNIEKFTNYGKLSGRSVDEMMAGARVEVNDQKKNPMDFALWKSAKEGEPSWQSPWGQGRPGWHIECSAMSLKYLGTNFDIHGGGFDLIFPHHENEIAQSEAYSGEQFARYWLHNGFITINQEKMSKSLGNFFLVRDILEKFSPEVVRFYLLSTHYRSPLDFDDEKLEVSRRGLERIKTCYLSLNEKLAGEKTAQTAENNKNENHEFLAALEKIKINFETAMDDDFNTSLAIGCFFDLVREINSFGGKTHEDMQNLKRAKEIFISFNQILGIFKSQPDGQLIVEPGGSSPKEELTGSLINLILDIRQTARKNKDFAMADQIRDSLKELGVIIEDSPQGSKWKLR